MSPALRDSVRQRQQPEQPWQRMASGCGPCAIGWKPPWRTGTVVFGRDAERLPNTSLFAAPGLRAETALINLDLEGFAVSSGSACSSGKVAASHVLAAMGVPPDLGSGAIRVSIGPATRENEIDLFLKAWMKHLAALSKRQSGLAA